MTAPAAAAVPLTDAEASVLRSWLGSNEVHSIAKARRMPVTEVTRILDEVCGFSRHRGRECLAAGHRMPAAVPPPPAPAPPPAPVVPDPPPIEVAKPARAPRPPAAGCASPPRPEQIKAQAIANPEQYRILLAYSAGALVAQVATDLGLPAPYVEGVVCSLARSDRRVAAEMVVRYERTHTAQPTTPRKPTVDEVTRLRAELEAVRVDLADTEKRARGYADELDIARAAISRVARQRDDFASRLVQARLTHGGAL